MVRWSIYLLHTDLFSLPRTKTGWIRPFWGHLEPFWSLWSHFSAKKLPQKVGFFRFWTLEAPICNKTKCTGGQYFSIWSPGCINTNNFTRSCLENGFFGQQIFSLMKNRGHFGEVALFLKRWIETWFRLHHWMSVRVYIDNWYPTCHMKYLYFTPLFLWVKGWCLRDAKFWDFF